jgi:hypothetical protein
MKAGHCQVAGCPPPPPDSKARRRGTRLLRNPTVSANRIAFACANNIWIVDRTGGAVPAHQLPGPNREPSPETAPLPHSSPAAPPLPAWERHAFRRCCSSSGQPSEWAPARRMLCGSAEPGPTLFFNCSHFSSISSHAIQSGTPFTVSLAFSPHTLHFRTP